MRRVVTLGLLLAASANAAPVIIEGDVVATTSRWTDDGSRIVTEAMVRTPDGDFVVSQLGGTVDGLSMRVFSMGEPEKLLAPGMRVAVEVREALDLAQRTHLVVEGMRVLHEPPGYVRTGPTKAGNFLYWESGCVYVTVDSDGTREIQGTGEFGVVDEAIAAWNTGVAGCSYLTIKRDANENREVGRDNVNLIKFRDTSWCRPAVGNDPARCYSPSAAGLTTAVYVDDETSSRDGAIVDGDIELNGVDFAIAKDGVSLGNASCHADLANTLTHEIGHLLGLEHPCRASADPPRVDGNGQPVPSCGSTSDPKIVEATMYNFQDCNETKKATLTQDDIDGICAIYPIAEDPGTCDHVGDESGWCNACRSSDRSPGPGFFLAVLVLLGITRRAKSSPSA